MDKKSGELFWNGKAVVTGKVVVLQRYERILATIVEVAKVAGALHPFGKSFGWWQ